MSLPLIGITTYQYKASSNQAYACSSTYTQAIANAGGVPVLIPLGLPEEHLLALFQRVDGLLFPGGGDIDPHIYGAADGSKAKNINADRDRIELLLARRASQEGKPFIGICRGFQVVNVALGGGLYVDIATENPAALKHDHYPDIPRDKLVHRVTVTPGTALASILAEREPWVNSLHHQCVLTLGEGLKPTAYAPDGLLEAMELTGHPFGLAVQWHPEELQAHEPMRRLFRAFVESTRAN